jgi:pimeloyl-ACP methyl ester carboxylesterase
MLDDVDAVFDALGLPAEQLLVFGRSVGAMYALELVARHPGVAGLVLESGIADPLERILLRVRPEELGATLAELQAAAERHLDHQRKLAAYRGPLLVLHAEHDSLIDASHAERLASWGEPSHSRLVLLPEGDHNSVMMLNWATYWAEIDGLVERLRRGERVES